MRNLINDDEVPLHVTFSEPLIDLERARRAFGRAYLEAVLIEAKGNARRAAEIAGVHRNTISRLCAEHRLPNGFGRRKGTPHAA